MKKDMRKVTNGEFTEGSDNVFADLGFPDAVELRTKVRLAVALQSIIKKRKLTQTQLAAELGVNQPKISALVNCKLDGFSVERLIQFLVKLGQDVEISVKSKPPSRAARIAVRAA